MNIQATGSSFFKKKNKKAVLGYEVIHQFTDSLAGISWNCHTLLSSKYKVILSVFPLRLRRKGTLGHNSKIKSAYSYRTNKLSTDVSTDILTDV